MDGTIEIGDTVKATCQHGRILVGHRTVTEGEVLTVREIVTFGNRRYLRFTEFINPIHDYGPPYGKIEVIYSELGFSLVAKYRTHYAVFDYAAIRRNIRIDW